MCVTSKLVKAVLDYTWLYSLEWLGRPNVAYRLSSWDYWVIVLQFYIMLWEKL